MAPTEPRDASKDRVARGSDMEFEFEKIPSITSPKLRELLMAECDKYAAEPPAPE